MKGFPKYIFFFFTALFLTECMADIFHIQDILILFIICILLMGFICVLWHILGRIRFFGTPLYYIENRQQENGRKSGGDIIRTIAVLFVPFLHFFGLSGYYDEPLDYSLIWATALRWLTICAVPLFMIITGYFKAEKRVSVKHYLAIFPLLLTHIVISGIRIYVDMRFHNVQVNIEYVRDKLLFFEYGWYIRLYIGMLFLMPFFNGAYNSLKSRTHKEIFVLTLCAVNFLGPLTGDIIPSSWLILYVFGYYAIGLFIKEYKIHINPVINIGIIAFFIGITTAAAHAHCGGEIFDWDYMAYSQNSGYSSLTAVIVSSLLMILCIDINIKGIFAMPFKLISMVSLEMYLFTQMFDGFIYPRYTEIGYDFKMFFGKFFIVTGMSIAAAFIASHIVAFFTRLIRKLFAEAVKTIVKVYKNKRNLEENCVNLDEVN